MFYYPYKHRRIKFIAESLWFCDYYCRSSSEYGQPFPEWVEIKYVIDKKLQKVLELQIDKGEASAIALAMETPDSTIIIDDQKARKVAESLGINITGTIGVIIKAKESGIIPAIKSFIEKIKKSDFRLSDELELKALKIADE